MHNCVAPFTSHGTLHEFGAEKQFPELNWHILTFLNKFYCLESHTQHCWRCSKSTWAWWIISQEVVWFLRCVTIGIQPTTRVFFWEIFFCHFFTWKYLILMYSMVYKWKENDPYSPGIEIINRKKLTYFYNFWKFYFNRTSFTLDELVSFVKVFKLFRLEWIVLVFRVWTQ